MDLLAIHPVVGGNSTINRVCNSKVNEAMVIAKKMKSKSYN